MKRILTFNEMRNLPLKGVAIGLEDVIYKLEIGEGLEWADNDIKTKIEKYKNKAGKLDTFNSLSNIGEWKRKTKENIEGQKEEDIKPQLLCYIPEITPPICILNPIEEEQELNESSIWDADYSKILTHDFLKHLKDAYEDDFNINQIHEDLDNITYKISDNIENGKLTIYRIIMVDDEWFSHLQKEGKRLGIYWSWDETAAEAHWGHNSSSKTNTVLLTSVIDEIYIDWIETLRLNIHPFYLDEKEIRLFKNTPIDLVSLQINGEEFIDKIDKDFIA